MVIPEAKKKMHTRWDSPELGQQGILSVQLIGMMLCIRTVQLHVTISFASLLIFFFHSCASLLARCQVLHNVGRDVRNENE